MSSQLKTVDRITNLVFASVLPLDEHGLSPEIRILRIPESGLLDDGPGLRHVLVLQFEVSGHAPENKKIEASWKSY